ncbi:unnamed protein product [Paramecium primaurelia]|uniref:OTU domain-containing protein n=1 Tax=Paramecium primaurelia TaxID=5886 RepID=A0A8S1M8N5_PARPR|nr:unnamed protein product [Paramecium primaurelia]
MSQKKNPTPHYMKDTASFQNYRDSIKKKRNVQTRSPNQNIDQKQQQQLFQGYERENYHKQNLQQQKYLKGSPQNIAQIILQNDNINHHQKIQKNQIPIKYQNSPSPQRSNQLNKNNKNLTQNNQKLHISHQLKQEQKSEKKNKSQSIENKSKITKSPYNQNILKQEKNNYFQTPVKYQKKILTNSYNQQLTQQQVKTTKNKKNNNTIKKEGNMYSNFQQSQEKELINQREKIDHQSNYQPLYKDQYIQKQQNKKQQQYKQQQNIDKSQKQTQNINQVNKQTEDIDQQFKQQNNQQQQYKLYQNIEQQQPQQQNIDEQNKQKDNIDQQNKQPKAYQIKFDQKRLDKTVELAKSLTQISSQMRKVEQNYSYYLQQYDEISGLFSHYSIKQLAVKNNLKKYCQKILYVRGDGNCFYTAFGFQYLNLLLIKFDDNQFNEFFNFVKEQKIQFKIIYENFQIDDEKIEQLLLEQFLYILQQIRKIQNQQDRINAIYQQFREFEISNNGNGCLYFLSTIFFRNLSNQLLEYSDMKTYVEDRINLITWETECNNNEIIIATLAQQLKINIKLLFFQAGQFELRQYEENQEYEIILLIQPGHYNIGLRN